jgi:hypothetical protein
MRANGMRAPGHRSGAAKRVALAVWILTLAAGPVARARLLIPMDLTQSDHLKAYGVVYRALEQGENAEWLLNYRGGSFLVEDHEEARRTLLLRDVRSEPVGGADEARILADIEAGNMETIRLEKAPRVAVYIPPPEVDEPWDDAVILALTYAEIPFERIYDADVQSGRLTEFDWLHLHHEDFTGQYGKFYASYHSAAWYIHRQQVEEQLAGAAGYATVWQYKHATAQAIKQYVARGGFLFSMCSGTDALDIALAAGDTDICAEIYDGDPADPQAQARLDFGRCLAFTDFTLVEDPLIYEFSDVDMTNAHRGLDPEGDVFTLFEFSAKEDPVPTMLTQCHVNLVAGFMGQTTSFKRSTLKPSTLVLAEGPDLEEVRYVHGNYGKGTFTFLGGHDPEDYEHRVGDPPTKLELHRTSPGYRLILNNVLFPAAQKKERKT